MIERFDSYCGIYCGACSTPICNGCKVMNENHHSPDCRFIKCAQDKEVESCCFCDENPCNNVMEMGTDKYPHHWTVIPNGRRIKEVGLEAWLEEQKQRWSCQQCGAAFTWYESKCRSCGADLFSVQAEFGEGQGR